MKPASFHAGHAGKRRAVRILVQFVDNPLDSILQVRRIEVDQETDAAVGEPQVGLQLLLEYGCKPLDRLEVPGPSAL